jgi:hypothetical protein
VTGSLSLRRGIRFALLGAVATGLMAVSACTSAAPGPGQNSPSATAAKSFSSENFLAPLTLDIPADLGLPLPDSANLLSWWSGANDNDRVRFLVPVVYYPAGPGPAQTPPTDWDAYFGSLAGGSISVTNKTTVAVDGNSVTVQTGIGSAADLDGSLGCPAADSDRIDDCFGFGSEFAIRFAVLHDGDTTVVAWARTDSQQPDKDFLAQFDRILSTVKFS